MLKPREALDTKRIIADNLNRLMKYRNLSRKKVCADLDVKYTTFCEWVNGRAYPRIEALESLATYFGVHVGDFFVDIAQENSGLEERVTAFIERVGELDLELIKQLTDQQLLILLQSGVQVRKKSLEDFIAESGHTTMIPSMELQWGEAVGDEIW